MNVITLFQVLLTLQTLTLAVSLQEGLQSKPQVRKSFHYEVLHRRSSESAARPYISPLDISTRFPTSYLPSPRKLLPQPPPLIPDILNNIFQQAPSVIKEVANSLIPDHYFIPNRNNEPAATLGQIENYRKDLEEQAAEQEQEKNRIASPFRNSDMLRSTEPKLFVSVNGGLYNYNYTV